MINAPSSATLTQTTATHQNVHTFSARLEVVLVDSTWQEWETARREEDAGNTVRTLTQRRQVYMDTRYDVAISTTVHTVAKLWPVTQRKSCFDFPPWPA